MRGQCGRGEIGDVVVRRPAERERHRVDRTEVVRVLAVFEHEAPGTHAAGRTAAVARRGQQRHIGIGGKPCQSRQPVPAAGRNPPIAMAAREQRIVGVQHQRAVRVERPRHRQLHGGEVIEVVDAVLAEVVVADVGDDGDVRTRHRKPAPQDAATRRFEHGRVDVRSTQREPRAGRSGVIARRDLFRTDANAIGARVDGTRAMHAQDRSQHACRRRLAIRTRHQRDRHVAERRPVEGGGVRQFRQRNRPCATPAAERQLFVVEQDVDAMPFRGTDQRHERRVALACSKRAQGPQRGGFVPSRGVARSLRPADVGGCTVITGPQRREQRPLVHLGRGEKLVDWRRQRERCAAGVPTLDRRAIRPAERRAHAPDASTPASDQGVVDRDANGFEHRAGAGEEQVAAGEASRIVERRDGVGRVQSSTSRDRWMPRSSRTTPPSAA